MSEDVLLRDRITWIHKILLLSLLGIIVIVISYRMKPIINLSENQILYLMSTMAQVVSGLFGLVLAAYAIIDPKLKAEEKSNEEAEESLRFIRKKCHDNIIVLSVLCAGTLFLCFLTLVCFEDVSAGLVSALLNLSSVWCISSVILFLVFGCRLLNPNALSNLNRKALEEVNNDYKEEELQDRPFIEVYNRLERLIIKYAYELMQETSNYSVDKKMVSENMQICHALKVLQEHKIINDSIRVKINELRRYRNALIHSNESGKVNYEVYNDLQEMYRRLSDVYENKDNDTIRNNKLKELFDFGERALLSKRDKAILDLINANAHITMRELSEKSFYSKATVSRVIEKLCQRGKLVKENGQYKVLIDKSVFSDEDKE